MTARNKTGGATTPSKLELCRTGEDTIDAHHAHLAAMIDKAASTLTSGRISPRAAAEMVNEIRRYAETHFAYEESVVQKVCPIAFRAQNKRGHGDFRAEIARIQSSAGKLPAIETYVASLKLLREWLEGHVCNVDCRIRDYLAHHD